VPDLSRRRFAAGALALTGFAGCASAGAGPSRAPDNSAKYSAAWDYLSARRGKALLVWTGGRLAHESYAADFGPTTPHTLYSASKSFWGPVAACMIEDGLLSGFDEPVSRTLASWASDPAKRDITIRQVLSLQSGIDPGERGPANSQPWDVSTRAPVIDPAGTRFRYGPNNYGAFGAVMREKMRPRGEGPLAYLSRRILTPIGSNISEWREAQGDPVLQGGALFTAPDYLRYGRLLLANGRWEGRQIIPAAGLQECLKPSPANPAYGLTFWLNRGRREGPVSVTGEDFAANFRKLAQGGAIARDLPADIYAAVGGGGQRLYVAPSNDLTAVVLSTTNTFDDAVVLRSLLGIGARSAA
jgi:CubicO group peptidase (beta-lactamase class C family)